MDFTNIYCISEKCKKRNVRMGGAGGHFGGRITIAKVRCPVCDLTLLIVPMNDEYSYNVSATTEQERLEQRIKKAQEENELELARKITRIKETGY